MLPCQDTQLLPPDTTIALSHPFAMSPPAQKQRRKPALDVDNLLQKLLAVDESSLTELQEFKRALQTHITSPSASSVCISTHPVSFILSSTNPALIQPVSTLPAAKLTRAEVFTYFGLRIKLSEKWGIVVYDIPTFELVPSLIRPVLDLVIGFE